jgi:GntR family transcriptional regulator
MNMAKNVALNPSSPLPLYQQLAERLTAQIRSGSLSAGSKLPSEPSLAKSYRIGRPTVRQATDVLVQRRLVERKRGAGTYVLDAPASVDLFSLAGTLSSFERQGIRVETRLLKKLRKEIVCHDDHNPFAGREAYCFSRVSRARRRPVLYEELYLDPTVFADLERFNLEGASLARIVRRDFFRTPSSATQHFSIHAVEAEQASALRLRTGAAVLLVHRHLHFDGATSAIYGKMFCRTDEFVFSQTIGAEHVNGETN